MNTPEVALLSYVAALSYLVATAATITEGGIACVNTSGEMVPAADADTTLIPVGRTEVTVTGDGVLYGKAKPGVYELTNSAAGDAIAADDVGKVCYLAGEATVALTDNGGTRSKAGVIVGYNAATGKVAVAIGFAFFSNPAATPSGTILKKTLTVPFNHATLLAEGDDGDAVDINVGTALPAGAFLVASRYQVTTPFVGAGLATLTMKVGYAGDVDGVIEAVDILGDAAAQYGGVQGTAMGPQLASAKQLVANFDPDNAAGLDELTAGSVTIDVYYFVAF